MAKYVLALFMALLVSCASAGWVAQIAGNYSDVDYTILKYMKASDGTVFTVGNDTASYKGHYGNYTVSASKTPEGISVLVSGADESMEAMNAEMEWLSKTGALPKGTCSNYSIYEVSQGGYQACNGKVTVFYCPACEIAGKAVATPQQNRSSLPAAGGQPPVEQAPPEVPAPIAAPLLDTSAGSVQSLASSKEQAPASPQVPQGFVEDARNLVDSIVQTFSGMVSGVLGKPSAAGANAPSQQGAAGSAEKSAAQAGAPQQQEGINTMQVVQLLAAFILVVIASYLVLSSRPEQLQVQQMDPQAERLLLNETRAGIMNELSVADKIPTDLSHRLGKSKAAIVEHLAELIEAGLVEKLETPGKKFVYYRITQKGRQILLRKAA